MSPSKVLFMLTGSIACYKACDAISRLVQNGHKVRVVTTPSALRFVGAATLEGLTGGAVSSDMFDAGKAMEHINLTRWADVVVVCPATANTINRFAAGLADDLVGALFLAHDRAKPLLIAPAMNPAMWSHPATRASVETLRGWGVRFVAVGAGRTACGEEGEGRMAGPPEIVTAVEAAVARPVRRLRVLVTSGGTTEPIDGVRVLTNRSTGRTGAMLATHLRRNGHDVVLLRARNAVHPEEAGPEEIFETFAELDAALGRRLEREDFDAVIHAAAVGDFSVESANPCTKRNKGKLAKIESGSPVVLRLSPQPKLVDGLRARSRRPLTVVAFKLTCGADEPGTRTAVARLFAHSGADIVVHNDLTEDATGTAYPATIHPADGAPVDCADRQAMARQLERMIVAAARPAATA